MARLVDDEQLTRSSVVANSDMNRARGPLGRDGYQRVRPPVHSYCKLS